MEDERRRIINRGVRKLIADKEMKDAMDILDDAKYDVDEMMRKFYDGKITTGDDDVDNRIQQRLERAYWSIEDAVDLIRKGRI